MDKPRKFVEKNLKKPLKNILIHLKSQSWGIPHSKIMNAYEKESFYCIVVLTDEGKRKVFKYPIIDIFRIEEDYD